jgi:LytS/YehU family sensor histidine kinase
MNTLNNIHALIDYSKEEAQGAVLKLSRMMRYLLYEADKGKTTLAKEVEFLRSYIELMKLRLQPDVELTTKFPENIPDVEIQSLLMIPFIENCFKHGIHPKKESFIHILLEVTDDNVHFNCRNSKGVVAEMNKGGGIGLENAGKRLELLFDKEYQLNIYDREQEFELKLICYFHYHDNTCNSYR